MTRRARGRGAGYSFARGVMESILRVAFYGDWPARIWSMVPRAAHVHVVRLQRELRPGPGGVLRIAFASDLHIGPTTARSTLDAAFRSIRAYQPDVLLLGGDFVFLDATPARLRVLTELSESIACPIKLAVMGNHDLWTDDAGIVETLTRAGVRVLVNEIVTLTDPWSDIVVIGLDDPWTGHCDPGAVVPPLSDHAFRIVLCHSPDGVGKLSGVRFDIFLAGHTHGGQISTPWGPVVVPHGELCRQYLGGVSQRGDGLVCISRGVGGVELPIRTYAPPDVVLLELTRSTCSTRS